MKKKLKKKDNLNFEHLLLPNIDKIQSNKIFSISVNMKINEAIS